MIIYVVFYYTYEIDHEYMLKAFKTEKEAEDFKLTVNLDDPDDNVYWKQTELVE